jgi:two-component system nitrogen regulation response regulator GlnG
VRCKVLVVDDDRAVRHLVQKTLETAGVEVITAASAEEGLELLSRADKSIDVCLLDILLPDLSGLEAFEKFQRMDTKLPIVFITSMGSSDVAIDAMKRGAYDYIFKPIDASRLRDLIERAADIRRKMLRPVGVVPEGSHDPESDAIIGVSLPMQAVYKAIGRVATQDVTVLIQGESGTGKELVARAVYQHSERRDKPFIAVNCAAIPSNLLESELFGHERGAFTGADRRRIGKFEQCNGGTIFLDEIGDMPSELQSKMLRLLQQQEFTRVGGNESIKTDVRIIAATNQNLEQMVQDGGFREDLYYRLKGFLICLPPLRERGDDIQLLAHRIFARFNDKFNSKLESMAPEVLDVFKAYAWPGNVRELENVLRQAILQTTGAVLLPEFLPPLATNERCSSGSGGGEDRENGILSFVRERLRSDTTNLYAEAIEYIERRLLPEVLRHVDGNQTQAASILGITRGSLRNKLRGLNISVGQVVSVGEDGDEVSSDA